jgi:hypothetical protein
MFKQIQVIKTGVVLREHQWNTPTVIGKMVQVVKNKKGV